MSITEIAFILEETEEKVKGWLNIVAVL